jgi:lipopolysaccharide/colanic/teichoic acid biosynthesis glycosyltransferase
MNAFYIILVLFLFLLTLPIQLGISLLLVLTSGFPILFKQKRVGKNNHPFVMYKFRTMTVGAEEFQKKLLHKNEADGPVFKIHNDPRFTSFGKFLSHTGLDELPQLWNILKGDMAFIGPRPLPEREVCKLTQWQQKRHGIKPGIISPWILNGYHSSPFKKWMQSDIEYGRKKSIVYDALLLFRMLPYLGRLFIGEVQTFVITKIRPADIC